MGPPICGVSTAGRNAQFDFSACINIAPYDQLTSNKCRAFPHAGKAVMALGCAREDRRLNALPIVAYTQAELVVVIADFRLDLLCPRVAEGIPQRLDGYFVNFIADDWVQSARLAFNDYMKGRPMIARASYKCLSNRPYGKSEIIAFDHGRAQSLYRIAAFLDCLSNLLNRAVQRFLRFPGALSQQVRNSLEPQ
jgi:hypothetical protein